MSDVDLPLGEGLASADPQAVQAAVNKQGFGWTVATQSAGAYPAPYADKPVAFGPKPRLKWTQPFFEMGRLFGEPPPKHRDWREGRQLTPAGEQGSYRTCSAFAVAGIVADLVSHKIGAPPRALSAGHLHRCLGGLDPQTAVDPDKLTEVLKAKRVAYESAGDYPFDTPCAAVVGVQGIASYSWINTNDDAKRALGSGPVLAVMNLHDDFWPWYGGGVYEPVGKYRSPHSIIVVGYSDPGGYWIARNSHGPGWGEGGYCKIRYDTCGIFDFHSGLKITL
jgi:hypothetical protein